MNWTSTRTLVNDERMVRRFAWFPLALFKRFGGLGREMHWVWLQRYWAHEQYFDDGESSGWATLARSLEEPET